MEIILYAIGENDEISAPLTFKVSHRRLCIFSTYDKISYKSVTEHFRYERSVDGKFYDKFNVRLFVTYAHNYKSSEARKNIYDDYFFYGKLNLFQRFVLRLLMRDFAISRIDYAKVFIESILVISMSFFGFESIKKILNKLLEWIE